MKEEIENDKSVTMVTENHPDNLAIKYAASYGCLSVKATPWKGEAEYYKALASYYEECIRKASTEVTNAMSSTGMDRECWLTLSYNTLENSLR